MLPAVLLWTWLFWHLRDDWTLSPQYNYGWIVPFAAVWIFWNRWRRRPPPVSPGRAGAAVAVEILCFLSLLPLRVIEIANPDWRLLSWTLGAIVAAVTLAEIYRAGGPPWARHFAFAALFPLIGVPWLMRIENAVVQSLTLAVAASAVEIAGWLGVGAFRLGNIIELHNGFVGVDEACSGVRTLQAGLMVALVLGEIFSLSPRRRFFLLLFGGAWVFLCNVARATILVVVSARTNIEAMTRWHDPIGLALLLLGIGGILFIAWRWRAPEIRDTPASSYAFVNVPRSLVPAALLWLLIVFASAELWYRAHEKNLIAQAPWTAIWPSSKEGFRALPIPAATHAMLRYDDASSAEWHDPPGVRWWGFFARWHPSRAARQLVHSHSPDICLPATGRTFVREGPPVRAAMQEGQLLFRSYEFTQADRPLFVFVAVEDDEVFGDDRAVTWDTSGRLRAAWHGRRNPGQRLLELAVLGLNDYATAKAALQRAVAALVANASSTG